MHDDDDKGGGGGGGQLILPKNVEPRAAAAVTARRCWSTNDARFAAVAVAPF